MSERQIAYWTVGRRWKDDSKDNILLSVSGAGIALGASEAREIAAALQVAAENTERNDAYGKVVPRG